MAEQVCRAPTERLLSTHLANFFLLTERLGAPAEQIFFASDSDLESPVKSHRALAEASPSARQTCLAIARRALGGILQPVVFYGSCRVGDDSKSLLLVERFVAAAERSVGLVV